MKTSVYDIVTENILSRLKKGTIPWKKNWSSFGGLPRNFQSGHVYRGINLLLLALNEYESPYYLTFNQVKKLGGTIKKGSSSQQVVFWKVYKKSAETNTEAETGEESSSLQKRFVLRYYNVFNSCQIEGIDFPTPQTYDHHPIEEAQQIWEQYSNRPQLIYKGNNALYSPTHDRITLPPIERFVTPQAFHKTLFHEAIHSTGHPSRIDRGLSENTDKISYSFEELIAEIGASFLCAEAGIQHDEVNTQAYINGWVKFLEEEHARTIVSAASKAKQAAQYILGTSPDRPKKTGKASTAAG